MAADEVNIKEVLPAFTLQGPGLDFGQVNVTQSKYGQALKQRAGHIVHRKNNRSFGRAVGNDRFTGQNHHARIIFSVVLHVSLENVRLVNLGGAAALMIQLRDYK